MTWRTLLTPKWAQDDIDELRAQLKAAKYDQRQATRAYANYRKGNEKVSALMDALALLTGAITARNLPAPEKIAVHPLLRDSSKIDLQGDFPRADGGYEELRLYGIVVESAPGLPDGYVVLKPRSVEEKP